MVRIMSIQFYLTLVIVVVVAVSFTAIVICRNVLVEDIYEKIKLDITLDEMREAENRIKSFLKKNDMEVGTPISEIAVVLKVRQGEIIKGIRYQAQLSNADEDGMMTVDFKEGLTAEERRFAFAHECAHLLNEDPVPIARPDGRNKPSVEQKADYTAAALLMPIDPVYKYLEENGYKEGNSNKRNKLLNTLCREYGVTKIIALRRINEVYALKN
jgi:Zn-dependent peptidase ImmA (M78 family)